jgi:hypothetical protein
MTTVVESNPSTWNEAAKICVDDIASQLLRTGSLDELRYLIDYMINISTGGAGGTLSEIDVFPTESGARLWDGYWANFGSLALVAGQKKGIFPQFDAWPAGPELLRKNELIKDISDVLVRKQRDYGHENISRFGRIGLLVRCHDKVARLENLEAKGVDPQNESVSDNYMDVIGYSAIGMMWERGWFKLQLS